MKQILMLTILALIASPAFSGSTHTTTTRSYDTPIMGTDLEFENEEEMMEAQEDYDEMLEQERMEELERSSYETEDMIDYSDRTRTNRERKAINTGSDASDDQ